MPALVLVHCCTVAQQHAITVGTVERTTPKPNLEPFLNTDHRSEPYAWYAHLLDEPPGLPELTDGARYTVRLLTRMVLSYADAAGSAWLRDQRSARMTILARAGLRQRLACCTHGPKGRTPCGFGSRASAR
jgi:hypothetical protein